MGTLPSPAVTGLPPRFAQPSRCLVMGVVNVTPDSFSDGGRYLETPRAVEQGVSLLAAGADIIDVGGESTRPGAQEVPADEQIRRISTVVATLRADCEVISVDTTDADVARAALEAGATIVNDVSGGLADRRMFPLIAETGAPYVLMHWRGPSAGMNALAVYDDVVRDVHDELSVRLDAFVAAGGDPGQVVLDPGLGFAKDGSQDWQVLQRLDALADLGRPVLVGASRKRFLGSMLAAQGRPSEPVDRDAATAAITAIAADRGAWGVRVHEAAANADAVRTVAAMRQAGGS